MTESVPEMTGRYLVLLREGAGQDGVKALRRATGLTVTTAMDAESGTVKRKPLTAGTAMVFDRLGVAVVTLTPDQVQALRVAAAETDAILAIEPERGVYALNDGQHRIGVPTPPAPPAVPSLSPAADFPVDYLRGYRDGVNQLAESLLGEVDQMPPPPGPPPGEAELTWGLQVTKVGASAFSGQGIKLAVLDTGLDLEHPDFAGRQIRTESFIPDEAVQDGNGHGTHCIGTACGPRQPDQLPRYGIAYDTEIYAGKVLSNQGSGTDTSVLGGIEWAIANGCAIISMSLGASVCDVPDPTYSEVFEQVARRALRAGTVVIAAAGNDSERPDRLCPVAHPANCPSIMAVAALDQQLQIAPFSNAGLEPEGGQVDIAAPGVAVRSSWPLPTRYRTISGTSMATPHVAGIAALLAEAEPEARGLALISLLAQRARRLPLPGRDVGAGLVMAP